jgi:hypothetical protein
MVGAPNFGVSLLRRVGKNGLPCRSRASPPAAPRRPPAQGIGIVPHPMPPCHAPHHPPARLRPQPRSSPQSSANPPTSSDEAGKRIGHLFWRVRSFPSRFAVGRSRPQQETFRRPTAILVDPAPPSAALVHTDFARQSPSPKARPSARSSAPLSQWANLSQGHCRPVEIVRRVRKPQCGLQKLRRRNAHGPFGWFVSVCRRLRDEPPVFEWSRPRFGSSPKKPRSLSVAGNKKKLAAPAPQRNWAAAPTLRAPCALAREDGLEHIEDFLLTAPRQACDLVEKLASATGGAAAPLRLRSESEQ